MQKSYGSATLSPRSLAKQKSLPSIVDQIRRKMTEPAFAGAGKAVGLEVWRIEALKPVKQSDVSVFSMKIRILSIFSVYTNSFSFR